MSACISLTYGHNFTRKWIIFAAEAFLIMYANGARLFGMTQAFGESSDAKVLLVMIQSCTRI